MVYSISGYDPVSDDLVTTFVIPDELSKRVLEIIGTNYDGASDYNLSRITLDSVYYALSKVGFKINHDLNYSIGPLN